MLSRSTLGGMETHIQIMVRIGNGEWAGTSLHIPADNYDIHVATNLSTECRKQCEG